MTGDTLHAVSNAEQIDSRVERAIPVHMMVDELMLAPVADRCVLNALFQCSIARSQGMFVPFCPRLLTKRHHFSRNASRSLSNASD